MIERRSGSVINMASVGGIIAVRDRLAYTTTKFAVVGLTKALALTTTALGSVSTPFALAASKRHLSKHD